MRWFLDWIRDRELIGWMDFIAHFGVNVTLEYAMSYMGTLYADNIVLPAWLFSLELMAVAETRGWIHQESAYGALDSEAVYMLLGLLREVGKRMTQQAGDREMMTEFYRAVGLAARLLACRGYEGSVGDDVKKSFQGLKGLVQLGLQGDVSEEERQELAAKTLGSVPSVTACFHVEKLLLAEDAA